MKTETETRDDYDSPWKEAIEHYFPELMTFFFPDIAASIEWTKGFTFLDQELRSVVRDAESGKRYVDKLVRIHLKTGGEQWIYIHIEVQVSYDHILGKRIFTYNYRIFDRFEQPVASLVILADDNPNWRPNSYSYEPVRGCKTGIDFRAAKLTDYQAQLDDLQASDNVFALIAAAHILTRKTRKNDQERYQAKRHLVRILYGKGWDKQKIIDLFGVIDWMMWLPPELAQQLWHDIETIEEQEHMRYVTSVERFERERLVNQGESKLLRKQLERRFGPLPALITEKLGVASEQELESWGDAVLTAPTLEDVFKGTGTVH
jgi:hypothetical protein